MHLHEISFAHKFQQAICNVQDVINLMSNVQGNKSLMDNLVPSFTRNKSRLIDLPSLVYHQYRAYEL